MFAVRRRTFLKTLALFALMLTAPVAQLRAATTHLNDAETLIANLLVSKKNVYGSSPNYILWNGASSEAQTVCATFVTQLLQHSYGWTGATFSAWMGSNSPNAALYHDTIEAGNGFLRIQKVTDIRAGDILAIEYYDESTNSGHAMIAAGNAIERTATNPIVNGTKQYEIAVIDSSKSFHGPADTRAVSGIAGGIGKGTFRIYANPDGTIAGYSWSVVNGSTFYAPAVRHLVVGRLN